MSSVLEGRTAIITGASQGLGLAIARAFLAEGARVAICARDAAELDEAARSLGAREHVLAMPCDVRVPAEVSSLVAATIDAFGTIDILVNNAAVHGPKARVEDAEWLEWVHAIEVNLMGSVLTARGVIPHMRERHSGKIIQLSGGGATKPFPRVSAYAASKAAVIRFAETLAEELRDDGIDVNALAPGALNTRLLDDILTAGADAVGTSMHDRARLQAEHGGDSIDRAAQCAVFLASSASDGITGRLISAVWDPWEELATHRDELRGSDVYTLRRIVPADRGMKWGGD
jgi:3-oxoacyl-[acyl-carrier protein] reductase